MKTENLRTEGGGGRRGGEGGGGGGGGGREGGRREGKCQNTPKCKMKSVVIALKIVNRTIG